MLISRFETPSGRLLTSARIICLFGIIFGASYYLNVWNLDARGISNVSGTTPYWDFNNLWLGGKLATQGHVDYLFNMDLYRPAMDAIFGMDVPNQEWSYPPNMLLVGVPLSVFPPLIAYWVWTLGSLLMLHFAVRPLKLEPILYLAIMLSPVVFINAVFGQNGTFISALFIGALVQLPKRPILAGVLIGMMTIKPQFGLLLPFVLILSGNWRAFISASVTALALVLATSLFFGSGVWAAFLENTQPMMRGFMEAPFYHPYQVNSVTPFTFSRALGASVPTAYGAQAVVTAACIGLTIWLWRPGRDITHLQRMALTIVMTTLATPYGYTYDMVAVCAAIVFFVAGRQRLVAWPVFAVLWLYPLYNHILAWKFGLNIGAVIVGMIFLLLFLTWRQNKPSQVLSPA